jgi:hypothetical protein
MGDGTPLSLLSSIVPSRPLASVRLGGHRGTAARRRKPNPRPVRVSVVS